MNQRRIQKLVFSAVFCALTFAATWIFVPAPGVGNVNLGDGVLLLCAWILGGPWAVISAALGATLADLSSGFALYAPATLLIKALMVGVALLVLRLSARLPSRLSRILSAVFAEIVMVVGYFLYECLVLGITLGIDGYGIVSLANIPFNAVQGIFGILLATLVYEVLARVGMHNYRQ
jgi:uncharacterized membrane protein